MNSLEKILKVVWMSVAIAVGLSILAFILFGFIGIISIILGA